MFHCNFAAPLCHECAGVASELCVDVYACLYLMTHTGFCFTAALLLHCVQIWPVSCVCASVCVCVQECVQESVCISPVSWILLHCSVPAPLCAGVASDAAFVCVCIIYVCKSVCVSHHSVGLCYIAAFLLHCVQVWPVMLCLCMYNIYI